MIPLTVLVLLGSAVYVVSYITSIPPDQFNSQHCILNFSNEIRSFDHELGLVAGNQFISKISGCEVTYTRTSTSLISDILPVSDTQLVYCSYSNRVLHVTTPSLDEDSVVSETDVLYPLTAMCRHDYANAEEGFTVKDGEVYTAIVNSNGKSAVFSKFDTLTGASVYSAIIDMVEIQTYLTVFSKGSFAYSVYLDSSGHGQISRVCRGDTGSSGEFDTYRYGDLSCSASQVTHQTALEAMYDPTTERLYILVTRNPKDLSARLLCTFDMDAVDEVFDSGRYLYYDELGEQIITTNSEDAVCGDGWSQLYDRIQDNGVLVKSTAPYITFDMIVLERNVFFYLTDGETIDVWRQDMNTWITALAQTINTDHVFNSIQVTSSGKLYLIEDTKVIIANAFQCTHVKSPVQCYSEYNVFCSWSEVSWKCLDKQHCTDCVSQDYGRTFDDDYPNGLYRSTRDGCLVDTTYYTSYSTSTVSEVVKCDTPGDSPNTNVINLNNTCSGTIELTCDARAELISGDLVRTCQPSGEWTGNMPVCQEKRCSPIPQTPGSTLTSASTTVGSVVSIFCSDQCTQPDSADPVECLESTKWNATRIPACESKTCFPLSLTVNTDLVHSDNTCGNNVYYRCQDGHTLISGDLTRTCRPDGTWSGSTPFCRLNCPVPADPQHGVMSRVSTDIGDVITVTCNKCYKVNKEEYSGTGTMQCREDGQWSETVVCKEVTCPLLSPTDGVLIKYFNNTCTSRVEFKCMEGYDLQYGSDLTRYCLADGEWSGSSPTCIEPPDELMVSSPKKSKTTGNENRGVLMASAVIGWLLFLSLALFLGCIVFLKKRDGITLEKLWTAINGVTHGGVTHNGNGITHNGNGLTRGDNGLTVTIDTGEDGHYDNLYSRQVTSSTVA